MSDAFAILPAAGMSTRMGSTTAGTLRKPMVEIGGAPILIHTLRKFVRCGRFREILVPVRPEDRELVATRIAQEKFAPPVRVLEGGDSRQDSVWNALETIPGDDALIAIHDAVRPFIEEALIVRVLEAAEQYGAAILGLPAVDTLKQVRRAGGDSNRITATLPRERIVLAQTPQVFRLGLLRQAFAAARAEGFYGTDEAALLEHAGQDVYVVPGSPRNWKITTLADLPLAELFLNLDATPRRQARENRS